jgi:hypothetical protein
MPYSNLHCKAHLRYLAARACASYPYLHKVPNPAVVRANAARRRLAAKAAANIAARNLAA